MTLCRACTMFLWLNGTLHLWTTLESQGGGWVGVQSPGLSHQNPRFASRLWLGLGNKSTFANVRKKLFQLVKQSRNWIYRIHFGEGQGNKKKYVHEILMTVNVLGFVYTDTHFRTGKKKLTICAKVQKSYQRNVIPISTTAVIPGCYNKK